jgi:adenosylhomocysteine nucleosidase
MGGMTITVLTGLQQEASIFRGTPGLQVLCGATQRDNLAGLVTRDCRALVSAGCAGALAPDLTIGALVVASAVIRLDGSLYLPDAQWRSAVVRRTNAALRPFFSHPTEVCATAAERAALRARLHADVVDEESFAVAQVAAARNLPFLVLRAISDAADQTILPHDTQAQRPDGSEDIGPVIGDALQNPIEAIREGIGFGISAMGALEKAVHLLGADLGFGAR